ncbi:hypothetical protein NDA11_005124 [Ustilago hordei]|nr:hypothetical protein NDA11_005124 [Ustilago hordei]KAJ1604252.1 hypothetical protein NDA14_007273 [Ustilago hordei]UTT87824.1 hypothetical protein NDA17_004234 [Ustilago hordei]
MTNSRTRARWQGVGLGRLKLWRSSHKLSTDSHRTILTKNKRLLLLAEPMGRSFILRVCLMAYPIERVPHEPHLASEKLLDVLILEGAGISLAGRLSGFYHLPHCNSAIEMLSLFEHLSEP